MRGALWDRRGKRGAGNDKQEEEEEEEDQDSKHKPEEKERQSVAEEGNLPASGFFVCVFFFPFQPENT